MTGFAPRLGWACLFMTLATCSAALGNSAEATIIMRTAPAEALGRIFGLTMTIASLSQITAMLVAGFVLTTVDPRPVGVATGMILIVFIGVTAVLATTKLTRPRARNTLSTWGSPWVAPAAALGFICWRELGPAGERRSPMLTENAVAD